MSYLEKFLSLISTQAYAGCSPGDGGINLFDCLLLNSQGETVKDTFDTPATLVNIIVQNVFVVAGVLIFIFIIFAGFKFAMSGKSEGKEGAKEIIEAVAIGFLVMFSAYWIIQIIEIVFGLENII